MAKYDAEIEWIGFKKGAYINTGIYPTSLDLDILYIADDYMSFGWMYNNSANNTWIGAVKNTIWWKNYYNKYIVPINSTCMARRYKMNEGFYEDGRLIYSFTASLGNSQISSIPLYLGGLYDANISAMTANEYDYSGKPRRIAIYSGNTLVRDYVPVRVGQIGYLYDKVSDTLFGSDGTENFDIGADKVKTSDFTKADFINFRRRLSMSVLPYDAEVEYIESDGSAYIDTGVKATPDLSFSLTFYVPNYSDWVWFAGAHNGSAKGIGFGENGSSNRELIWIYASVFNHLKYYLTAEQYYTFRNDINGYNKLYVNGTSRSNSSGINTLTSNINLFLFTLNSNGSTDRLVSGVRCKGGRININNVLMRDYVPVRKDGKGYLYDKVTKALYGSADPNGSFTYGNDV